MRMCGGGRLSTRHRVPDCVGARSRLLAFFPLHFSSNLNQNQTRITIERDGKSSELQVDEGENILQVRRRVLVYLV